MKITVIHKNSGIKKQDYPLYDNFCKFLQKEMPLTKNIHIIFSGEKIGKMTTGKRTDKNILCVLTKGRLIRDILRTVAHEWAHEFDKTTEMNNKHRRIKNRDEAFANSKSGELTTDFEKKFLSNNHVLYNSINKNKLK